MQAQYTTDLIKQHRHKIFFLSAHVWRTAILLLGLGCGTLAGNPEEEPDDDSPQKQGVPAQVDEQPVSDRDSGSDENMKPDPDPYQDNERDHSGDNGDGVHKGPVSNPDVPNDSKDPTLVIYLTDAPVDQIRSLHVKIAAITLGIEAADGQEESNWVQLPLTTDEPIDIFSLQDGKRLQLGALDTLPSGRYNQLRILLDESYAPVLVDDQGVEQPVRLPSAAASGIKVQLGFEVSAETAGEVTLDFDLRKSLRQTGDVYTLQPFIRAVDSSQTGTVRGTTSAVEGVVCLYSINKNPEPTDACDSSIQSTMVKEGTWILSYVEPGNYVIRVFDETGALFADHEVNVQPKGETVVEGN